MTEIREHPEYQWVGLPVDLDVASAGEVRASAAMGTALLSTPSIRAFMLENFAFGFGVNEETRQFFVHIAPKKQSTMDADGPRPTVPKLSMEQKAEIRALLNLSAGVPDAAYRGVMMALGQEDDMIAIATPADVRVVEISKGRLDA